MFDDVMIAVSDDDSGLDALALGRALASPGAALTLVHVERGGADRETPQGPPAPLVYGASVDLLVLGPHDHGVQRASLAQRLARRPPCPLLVLATPPGP